MSDDKLKIELLYMVKLATKYDFTNMEVVEGILRLENERQLLDSVFGKRFKARIFDIAAGQSTDGMCVICGQIAENNVICNHCIDTIGGSDFAKNQLKSKKKTIGKFDLKSFGKIFDSLSFKNVIIKGFQAILLCCLILILFIQIWIFSLWKSIPDYNPIEKARVSEYAAVAVENYEDAYSQLLMDFPEDEGYTIIYVRMDKEYVGRFLLEKGDCCLEVEAELSGEMRYDYFFTEDVYVFYISYKEEHTFKLGIAEINNAGNIIIEGSFNDGRRTDSFYKYR